MICQHQRVQKFIYLNIYYLQYNNNSNQMKTPTNNNYDCQCNIFSKKNNVVIHKNNKISIKDKNALANKFGFNQDIHKRSKNKISMNGRCEQKSDHQKIIHINKKIQPIKTIEYRHTHVVLPSSTPFTLNIANVIKAPTLTHYQIQSPASIRRTILASEYFTTVQSNSITKRVEFSYDSNKSKGDDGIIKNASLKDLKQSRNGKTIDTLKRSDSETIFLQKRKSPIIQNIKTQTTNFDQKKSIKLSVLKAKSIISSGGKSREQECDSQISEVIESLLKRSNNHKAGFYFNVEDQ